MNRKIGPWVVGIALICAAGVAVAYSPRALLRSSREMATAGGGLGTSCALNLDCTSGYCGPNCYPTDPGCGKEACCLGPSEGTCAHDSDCCQNTTAKTCDNGTGGTNTCCSTTDHNPLLKCADSSDCCPTATLGKTTACLSNKCQSCFNNGQTSGASGCCSGNASGGKCCSNIGQPCIPPPLLDGGAFNLFDAGTGCCESAASPLICGPGGTCCGAYGAPCSVNSDCCSDDCSSNTPHICGGGC
jgi:hypothetical protein